MTTKTTFAFLFTLISLLSYSQKRTIPVDTLAITTGQVSIGGKIVPYKASAGMPTCVG